MVQKGFSSLPFLFFFHAFFLGSNGLNKVKILKIKIKIPEFLKSRLYYHEQIVVLMKVYWGDAREKICEAIENVPLSCLVIGNRGLGKIKR